MEIRYIVATHCNANCYFCLNEYIGSKSPEFTVLPEHYKLISKISKSLGVKDCTISGGEPTLRKDLAEITNSLNQNSNRVTLVSNGYLLSNQIKALESIQELHVSLHSMFSDEWARITQVKHGLEKVLTNIPIVRSNFPNLRIKLNVVAEIQNSSTEQIQKYLDFAKENNCDISLFQEGYFNFLTDIGMNVGKVPERSVWWNLEPFGAKLVSQTERKLIFDVQGVKIALSYTSTDKISWDSCWISPLGVGFVDVRHRSPLINFMEAFNDANENYIEQALISLFKECEIEIAYNNSQYANEEDYLEAKRSLFHDRRLQFTIAEPIPVSNLAIIQEKR